MSFVDTKGLLAGTMRFLLEGTRKRILAFSVPCLLAMLVPGLSATPAFASSAWWHLLSTPRPTYLAPGGEGTIVATVINVGDASTNGEPVEIVDRLPAGLKAVPGGVEGIQENGNIFASAVECSLENEKVAVCPDVTVPAFDAIELRVKVRVQPTAERCEPSAATCERNEVSVFGGGAPPASISRPVTVSEKPVPFGVEDYELEPEEEGGGVDRQAGSHPFQTTFTVNLNQASQSILQSGLVAGDPVGLTRDVNDSLPPGLIGNPQAVAHCTSAQFLAKVNECPEESVVGVAVVTVEEPNAGGLITLTEPVFNLEPSVGQAASFGFLPLNLPLVKTPVYIDASVRTGGDYGITGEVRDVPQTIAFMSNVVTFWGVPGAAEHNETRDGCLPVTLAHSQYPPCEHLNETKPPPFFDLPTSCPGVPMRSSVEVDSWEDSGVFDPANGGKPYLPSEPLPTLDGCNKLPFHPSIEVHPDVPDASSATGLDVDVKVPQEASLDGKGLGDADIRDTTVTLPAGVAINPAGAGGLEACANDLIGFKEKYEETELEPGVPLPIFTPHLPGSTATAATRAEAFEPGIDFCSNASKIATARLKIPLLKEELTGAVYLAPQEQNPFGSLVAMYIEAYAPESGVFVKLPGEVKLNPSSGQIESTFLNTPQAPAEEIELHFFGGERAPLATPAYCGSYTTTTSIVPWSAPESGPPATPSSTFAIEHGADGGPCPSSSLPFAPSSTGGALNLQAGAFSPFTTTLSRHDGEQNLSSAEVKLPPGLSGLLTGVELCREPQANLGTCSANSQIGETTVSVGVGGDPFTVTGGKVYLTGPYNGTSECDTPGANGCAPFGLSVVNPAKAGPYDLANTKDNKPACDCVLVRGKIEVNPETAALTVTSNPAGTPDSIPTSIEGIPLEIQHVNITTTRPGFQFNPTNCDKTQVEATLHSSEGGVDRIEIPFQVTNCATLKFTPKFSVSTSGRTSKADGASLTTRVTEPSEPFGGQANIAKVKVELPLQLPSRLTTLQKACTDKQFEANPAACPAASKIGYATVHTPLLPVPLTGPAIFVSHGGEAFPSLTMVLQGYGVTIDLVGDTDIKNGVTSTTFKTVPDQPFNTFELTLPEGPYSALAANGNLCKPTKTETVKVTSFRRNGRHGKKVKVTRKVKEQVATSLTMPNEFIGQNGMAIYQKTPIGVTGCSKSVHPKKAKHGKKKKHRGKGKKDGKR